MRSTGSNAAPLRAAEIRGTPRASSARERRPRVLVLDEGIPVPANTGKRIRTLNLLRRLSRDFQIDLLVHANGAAADRLEALRREGLTVHVAESAVREKRGSRFYMSLTRNLFSSLPYTVVSHRQPGYRSAMEKLLATRMYDLVHCEWTPYAVYRVDGGPPWVISAHNIESDVWSRLAANDRHPARSAFLGLQARRMAAFERAVFSSARFATAVSPGDARRLRDWGCPRVQLVPNGVDLEEYTLLPEERAEPRRIVFVGSMDWRANQDAIRWFVDAIHPRLMALCDYRLSVVGRNPPDWLRAGSGIPPQIEVTGEVEDVRPFLERSAVVIVPLRAGGGSRVKILEAFACGRPVVATRVGAEGLEVEGGEQLLIEDDPDAFAKAVMSLLANPERRRELAKAARRLVERRYGWTGIAEAQAQLWNEAVEGSNVGHALGGGSGASSLAG